MQNLIKSILSGNQSLLVVGDINADLIKETIGLAVADFEIIDSEAIKIVDVRKVLHWLYLRPMVGEKKVLVILKAELLNSNNSTTLLKTVEEPPSYASIVLVTGDEHRILPTIVSRCRKIRLPFSVNNNLPENYKSVEEIVRLNVKERFELAAMIAEMENSDIKQILTLWQANYRQKLLKGDDKIQVLEKINRSKDLLETNISVKLLIENLLLNF